MKTFTFQVKFLLNKPGAAMVEMSDHIACNTVIQCLGGQQLFDSNLEFRLVLLIVFCTIFLLRSILMQCSCAVTEYI